MSAAAEGEGELRRPAVEFITEDLLARLCAAARAHPRGRVNHDFHVWGDGYQRLLNAVQPGSYIRPHRHRDPGKAESFVVLQGEIALFVFDDRGALRDARRVGPGSRTRAVDLEPGVWHCFLARQPDTVVFEGKNGPYDPRTDKEFPDWAPAEGDPSSATYMEGLLRSVPPFP